MIRDLGRITGSRRPRVNEGRTSPSGPGGGVSGSITGALGVPNGCVGILDSSVADGFAVFFLAMSGTHNQLAWSLDDFAESNTTLRLIDPTAVRKTLQRTVFPPGTCHSHLSPMSDSPLGPPAQSPATGGWGRMPQHEFFAADCGNLILLPTARLGGSLRL